MKLNHAVMYQVTFYYKIIKYHSFTSKFFIESQIIILSTLPYNLAQHWLGEQAYCNLPISG